MSTTNAALLLALQGPWPLAVNDGLTAYAAGGQSLATPLRGGANRITIAASAGASLILPSLANEDEGAGLVFVVNDGANAISVFCAAGGTINGSPNGSLSIAAGGFAIFLKVMSTQDWRAAAFT